MKNAIVIFMEEYVKSINKHYSRFGYANFINEYASDFVFLFCWTSNHRWEMWAILVFKELVQFFYE